MACLVELLIWFWCLKWVKQDRTASDQHQESRLCLKGMCITNGDRYWLMQLWVQPDRVASGSLEQGEGNVSGLQGIGKDSAVLLSLLFSHLLASLCITLLLLAILYSHLLLSFSSLLACLVLVWCLCLVPFLSGAFSIWCFCLGICLVYFLVSILSDASVWLSVWWLFCLDVSIMFLWHHSKMCLHISFFLQGKALLLCDCVIWVTAWPWSSFTPWPPDNTSWWLCDNMDL